MIGISLGYILGNLPGLLLQDGLAMSPDGKFTSCTAVALYLALMFIMWGIAIYGYLAPRPTIGTNWSYACLLWAGFGGWQMLARLSPSVAMKSFEKRQARMFQSLIDGYLGCVIVLVVDLCFARFFGKRVTDEVANVLPLCLEDIASAVRALRQDEEGVVANGLGELKQHISLCRDLDGEVRKMDLVWNGRLSAPYREELVAALLDKMDSAYVSIWSIMKSTERVSDSHEITRIVRQVLPSSFAGQWSQGAEETREALETKVGHKTKKGTYDIEVDDDDDVEDSARIVTSLRPSLLNRKSSTPAGVGSLSVDGQGMLALQVEDVASEANADQIHACNSAIHNDTMQGLKSNTASIASRAAAMAARNQAWALRVTLAQVLVLLQEHSAWGSQELNEKNVLVESRPPSEADSDSDGVDFFSGNHVRTDYEDSDN